jgi:hypothetical protein
MARLKWCLQARRLRLICRHHGRIGDQDMSNTLNAALAKWESAKRGELPIVSDAMLDALGDHFQSSDNETEARRYFRESSTIHNPNRVGILDAYILRA